MLKMGKILEHAYLIKSKEKMEVCAKKIATRRKINNTEKIYDKMSRERGISNTRYSSFHGP